MSLLEQVPAPLTVATSINDNKYMHIYRNKENTFRPLNILYHIKCIYSPIWHCIRSYTRALPLLPKILWKNI